MKKYTQFGFYTLFIIGLMASCKNKNFEDHVGPSICASDKFQYDQQPDVSSAAVNLNSGPIVFTAKFNEEVPWTIKVTGLTSGAFKKFKGYGKSIDVSWVGNPDTVVFFVAEQCKVEFMVACKDPVIKNFDITTVNNFTNYDYLVFDGNGNGLGTGPYTYGLYATHVVTSGLNSPQGGDCFCTHGNSGSLPVWYFGGYDFPIVLGTTLNADPAKVYFNCFVNVQGSQNTIPVVTLKEGTAQRSKNLDVHGDGWYYLTFKLSDFGVINPNNISLVSFGLNAYPVQCTAGDMCIDFVTFTNEKPFISPPTK